MNREQAKELLPIITAFAEGKEIQFALSPSGVWLDIESPTFSENTLYRIKPKTKTIGYGVLIEDSIYGPEVHGYSHRAAYEAGLKRTACIKILHPWKEIEVECRENTD